MKKTLLSLSLLAAAAAATAAGSDLSVKLDLPYTSRYVYRGLQLAKSSLQPSLDLSAGDSYAGAWLNSPFLAGQKNEVNVYLGQYLPVPALGSGWKLDLGGRGYYFPQGYYTAGLSNTSIEAYAGLTGGTIAKVISPELVNYYDFTRKSYNVIASLGTALPAERFGFALHADVHVGYTAFRSVINGTSYTYWGAGLSLPYKLASNTTFTVGGQYDSSDLKGARHNLLTVTAGVSVGF